MESLQFLLDAPYYSIAILFIACGLGFPFPEEPGLLIAGFLCFKTEAEVPTMMLICVTTILIGDLIPFAIGKFLGPKVLKIRLLRFFITPERLARFDLWFRKRGDLVVFLSRFVVGLRIVSFFTAGTMRMSFGRFLLLDGLGVVIIAPPLIWLGNRFGSSIEDVLGQVKQIEHGLLVTLAAVGTIGGVWYWLRWQRRQKALVGAATDAFVGPRLPQPDTLRIEVGPRGLIQGGDDQPIEAQATAAEAAPDPGEPQDPKASERSEEASGSGSGGDSEPPTASGGDESKTG
ncbi:MAG: DedA family protein [Planctomycetota bacterium]